LVPFLVLVVRLGDALHVVPLFVLTESVAGKRGDGAY